ncbi:hypothetical protein K1T71_003951 [Dendrolimus kikuchii]|uniref:Uncharacterized protein n=1 Tax=Dendrolimus kikuchii TaxID=765133 RepID=A0ACC1DAW4_9NEOP|nr:hypothetical protein K1T71_003951 [Dendrolimus kikuchii]
MDDDCKEYRRNKPQQKLYKPGSGPLRRSSYGLDSKMDSHDINNSPRNKYQNHYGSQSSINDDMTDSCRDQLGTNTRHKKPEQQLYVPRMGDSCSETDRQTKTSMRYDNSSQYNNRRMNSDRNNSYGSGYSKGAHRRDKTYVYCKDDTNNDINYNRNYRQASETRSISPSHCEWDKNSMDRNRDSRSMESSAVRHKSGSGGKPPSGRRNSAGYASDTSRPKYMVNLDNIPPRFRKQFLEQSGHYNYEGTDQARRDRHPSNYSLQHSYNQDYNTHHAGTTSWSQTLPSRGRGRLRENESIDREKFINNLKNYDSQNYIRPTSNSYMNLYEPNAAEDRLKREKDVMVSSVESQKELENDVSHNGISKASTTSSNLTENQKQETDNEADSENTSQISTNLDWTEEVEKNIKLDDMGDSSTSFSQNLPISRNNSEDIKQNEPRDSKRSGKSRHKDRRSSSRGIKNSERKDRNRKDSTASIQHEPERTRKDSNASVQHETIFTNLKHRERERRDSHRSNRSSTIGNSRDDLDRWRSLRSYSREQSTEGRIVSQCNSRDTSMNRALSPRDNDGFRMPSAVNKAGGRSTAAQKKNNGSWSNGRTPSAERGPSPAPASSEGGGKGEGGGGGGRRARRRTGRRQSRATDTPQPTTTNWREEILESKKISSQDKNSENSHQRNRVNSVVSEKADSCTPQPGLIMLPQSSIPNLQKDLGRVNAPDNSKTLYDHQNPSKPIVVQTSPTKIDIRLERNIRETASRGGPSYDANDAARAARHRALLQEVDRADAILQAFILRGPIALAEHWNDVTDTRLCLQNALQRLLMADLKYCQADNVEHNFWKILYYNFIEVLRRSFSQISPENKPKIVKLINTIIDEGNVYFENVIQMLEKAYKFNVEDYINDNHVLPPKGLGYVGLALISVQKLYVFLGDLARYKEQVNETNNYAKSKLWYTKAQQINPKNGRPYNQLAILAIYARRKLDAVYYYMRSLMSSNPFQSARESLLLLFDENRKKYEAAERKRRAAAESSEQKSSVEIGAGGGAQSQRREVWRRPGEERAQPKGDMTPDHLASISSVELNKSFITSYLHVHGKLITKIGMETFYESASLMLRQFRALLHRQPLPTPAARLLQLTALNMFAVETTAASLKVENSGGERSAWLECALGVSLLMFGALVERCCALLPEPQHTQQYSDALLLLPALKVWSDWMLCHSSVWNPPPSFNNFDIENENDPWDWLAKLMNILEALDDKSIELENEMKEGHACVRLAEDASLGGFTPLMYMEPALAWMRADQATPHHAAEHALRTRKLLFFGTEYLVGVEPPVLRLEYPPDASPRYVSAVLRVQHSHPPLQHLTEDSEGEEGASGATSGPTSLGEGCPDGADEVTRRLLRRKEQLESRKATLERHRQRMQVFIFGLRKYDHVSEYRKRLKWLPIHFRRNTHILTLLYNILFTPNSPQYLKELMSELEGLRLGARVGAAAGAALAWARAAPAVRLATTRGSLLASRAFTAERDGAQPTNDDRVLATALNLHANLAPDNDTCVEEEGGSKCVRRVREVVLLTDDRNLRVKAMAAELPVRDLPSFIHWAGISTQDNTITQSASADDTVADRN